MPLITVQHTTNNKYSITKDKLIELFFTVNGLNINTLKSFYYDQVTDSLVFELNDTSVNENVNYSGANLTTP